MNSSIKLRKRIEVKGIVQGVGFRPFIYKLAHQFELGGFVCNNNRGVEIEIEGEDSKINQFIKAVELESPPLSEINELKIYDSVVQNSEDFKIEKSSASLGNQTFISPDVSICEDCKNELFDKTNRRYFYPFINCTNCGPRFTIIENIPYDRKQTTMRHFEMCDKCSAEYEDPFDRRFHAQPNACAKCGPKVWLKSEHEIYYKNGFEKAVEFILDGKIMAAKGLGGFHLAVDANNAAAVKRLRERKNREAKPLAIMVPDIETVRRITECDLEEEKILLSIERPILLLNKLKKAVLCEDIAPGNNRLGIMLPYTPLHYILFEMLKRNLNDNKIPALVMTSANLSEEPIAIDNDEAMRRLKNIADVYLLHDREILIRADDSVLINVNGRYRTLRRSRGFVPKAIPLLEESPSILGVGAELKNTICLSKNKSAFVSQHIGDLSNLKAYNFFEDTIKHLQKILDMEAEYIAYDMHPDYLSSKWARENIGHKSFAVQHHHAHLASCMLENRLDEKVIGIILDGTGLGYDGTIWGGEILIGNYSEFERFAHLEQFPLPGGDAAAKEPWRTALSYLYNSFEGEIPLSNIFEEFPAKEVLQILEKNINSPLTSSAGRLFDAVSFIAGGVSKIRYEAEAAIQITQAVSKPSGEKFTYDEFNPEKKIIPLKKMIREIFKNVLAGAGFTEIADNFHFTLTQIFLDVCFAARNKYAINKIVLSGGVFQNEVLLTQLENILNQNGFEVFSHSTIPTNDGGISLGQAAIAAKLIQQRLEAPKFIN